MVIEMAENPMATAGYVRKWAGDIRTMINNPKGNSNVSRELALVSYVEEKVANGFDPTKAGVTRDEMNGWRQKLHQAVIRWAEQNNMITVMHEHIKLGGFKSPTEAGVTDQKVLTAYHDHYGRSYD